MPDESTISAVSDPAQPLSGDAAADVWKVLFCEIRSDPGFSPLDVEGDFDPLSPSERKLYEALTLRLTIETEAASETHSNK